MARRLAWRTLPRLVRIGLWSLAGLVALVIAGGAIIALSFDPDSLKPRVIAAVKQATGRDLTLQGRIRLGLSLQPTLTVQGVAFANPPGFSRPQMATLEQLDLKLALIPLLSHRVEIDRLVLVKPDIILETDAQGRPNWQFTPASQPAGAPVRRRRQSGRGRRPASASPMCGSRTAPSPGAMAGPGEVPCSVSPACGPARRRPMPTSICRCRRTTTARHSPWPASSGR